MTWLLLAACSEASPFIVAGVLLIELGATH